MNVWIVQIGEPLAVNYGVRKMRASHLTDHLLRRGHSVVRWASAFDHYSKKMLYDDNTVADMGLQLKYRILKGCGYKRNISLRRYVDHRILETRFEIMAKREVLPDIIFTSTPPYNVASRVVRFAKKKSVPVVVDIRDEWPDSFVNSVSEKYRKVFKFLLYFEYKKLNYSLRNADAITAMMDGLKVWGLGIANRKASYKDKTFYLGAERIDNYNESEIRPEIRTVIASCQGKTVVTFIGQFNAMGNPSIIVDVAKRLYEENKRDIMFVIAGHGEHYERVRQKAEGLSNVVIPGWLDNCEIKYLLDNSDIGVCPITEDRSCFPNKLFSYLSAGLPIIASTKGEFKEIMQTYGIGLYYKPNDEKGLYSCLLHMVEQPTRVMEMRGRVKAMFNRYYESGAIYSELSDHLEKIVLDKKRT